ncbi:MAG TPA: Gfo/Idh/MocA family oxidoreductase [Candidatus Binataceae bacterium]|nr:Gfo/Idh/MocA family oxidoreductase [Candidatus Binataceae bacterium]
MKLPIKEQVRAGIVGAGLIGQSHSLMLREVADRTEGSVRVAAVADVARVQAEQLAARWPGARVASDAREIIGDPDIDAVWICTPTALHRDAYLAAVHAGKHVFCEKPLAMTTAEAAEMAEAARLAGVASQVGLVLRFSPVYTVIRAIAAAPEAGRMLAVTMRDDQDFPTRGVHASGWRNDRSLTAGGTLAEHSVHDFDLLTWMFGAISRLYCRTRNLNGAPGIEDFGAIEMEFAGGFHGQLTSVWHRMIGRPSNRRLEVFAENLFVACDHDAAGPITIQRADAAGEEILSESDVMRRFEDILLKERPYLAPMKDWFAVPYALEDAAFVAALRGQCGPDPEIRAGVAAQRLVEAAYESARTGVPVKIET